MAMSSQVHQGVVLDAFDEVDGVDGAVEAAGDVISARRKTERTNENEIS
jgi:hypothetical protein